jgi:hypothetical protein
MARRHLHNADCPLADNVAAQNLGCLAVGDQFAETDLVPRRSNKSDGARLAADVAAIDSHLRKLVEDPASMVAGKHSTQKGDGLVYVPRREQSRTT